MRGITDIVQQHLTPATISQISNAIGADPATTQQAVDAAIPMIIGGMANHAATPAGAATIQNEAANHAGILGQLGGMLDGAAGSGGLLGGLASMVGNAGGSGGLGGMLDGAAGRGGLGGMLGSAAAGGILGKVLGSSHADVTNGVTQATGLDTQKATKLLMILAPIVLAAIAHHQSTTGASATQMGDVLQQEAQAHAASSHQFDGILGSILNKATGQA